MKRYSTAACPRFFVWGSLVWGSIVFGSFLSVRSAAEEFKPADPAKTSTEWRDDAANLEITAKLNRAYARLPFSVEYEGVLDERPFSIDWKAPTLSPLT